MCPVDQTPADAERFFTPKKRTLAQEITQDLDLQQQTAKEKSSFTIATSLTTKQMFSF